MKMFRRLVAAAILLLAAAPVVAQQVQNHAVPIGRGGGVVGFGAAVPGTAGIPLVSSGLTLDPQFAPVKNVGIEAGAANTVKGSLNGTATTDVAVPACTGLGQAIRWTAASGWTCGTVVATTGFDMPINLGLSAAAASSSLTLTVTQADGSVPTAGNPVAVSFRSTTLTTGTALTEYITSSISITIPNGATLGATNNIPFRVWIFLNANGGTNPALGVATCSSTSASASNIFPCTSWESTRKTSITIDASADNAGVLYATLGVSNDAVRIVGYCDMAGLATAGAWTSSCTTLQVMGPGVSRPGEVVQTAYGLSSTATTGTGVTLKATVPSVTVTTTAAANLVEGWASGGSTQNSGGGYPLAQIYRASGAVAACTIGFGSKAVSGIGAGNLVNSASVGGYDAPGSAAQFTYAVCINNTTANNPAWCDTAIAGQTCVITIKEIMGRAPQFYDNDNDPRLLNKVG